MWDGVDEMTDGRILQFFEGLVAPQQELDSRDRPAPRYYCRASAPLLHLETSSQSKLLITLLIFLMPGS